MDALARFRRRYPKLQIALSIGNSDDVLAALRAYQCDAAVLARHDDDPGLLVLPLARHRLVLFVARGHSLAGKGPVALEALEGQPMILRERGSTTRRIFEAALARAGVRPQVVMEIESREAVREAVAAGLGLGVVSDAELGRDERLVAVPIRGPRLDSNEYLVCLRERARLRVVAAFLEVVGEVLAARRAGAG
jgi:DNA-binding transcriptional LysR family regulator